VTAEDRAGPLDVPTLEVLGRRARSHPLVIGWSFQPDAMSSRRLEVELDAGQYPEIVTTARLDVRWFEGGAYTIHYLESRGEDTWQCRWDRHPKPDGPTAHRHPPPDASADVVEADLGDHHLAVLFSVLDWVEARVETLHEGE